MRGLVTWLVGAFFVFISFGLVAKVGDYEKKNVEEIFYLAEAGDVRAQTVLGWMYLSGSRVPEDHVKGFEWIEKAAAQNDSDALFLLGGIYYDPIGVPQDYIKARRLFEASAEQDNHFAQFFLGVIYENGSGVKKDDVKAREWYEKSAVQENSSASYKLGLFYEEGKGGLKQDYAKAREWYKKAAELGDERAMEVLDDLIFIALSEGAVNVRASQLYKNYSENEVRASLLYGETPLVIEGKIDSIGFTPIASRPVLRFSVPSNAYASVQAVFRKEDVEDLAEMSKGEIVKVVCRGGASFSVMSVVVSGCEVP